MSTCDNVRVALSDETLLEEERDSVGRNERSGVRDIVMENVWVGVEVDRSDDDEEAPERDVERVCVDSTERLSVSAYVLERE